MTTALATVNAALLLLGASRLQSLEEESDRAELARATYADVRDGAISGYPWSWSMRRVALTRDATPPRNLYQYRYILPGDLLGAGPREVFQRADALSGEPERWDVIGDRLEADFEAVWIEYQRRVDEREWPPGFRQHVKHELAAQWAFALTDKTDVMRYFREKSHESMVAAMAEDGQSQPAEAIRRFPMFDARYGGG